MESLKDFISRNMPVFIIGGVTALIFLIVILLSQTNEDSILPGLIKIEDDSVSLTIDDSEKEKQPIDISTLQPEEVDELVENFDYGTGKYDESFSLLPGDPRDEAMEARTQWYYDETRLTPEEVDTKHGKYLINYTEEGFDPYKAEVYIHQTVVWINNTDKAITLSQISPRIDEWKNSDKTIAPGDSFEYQIPEIPGNWTYEEATTHKQGKLYIQYSIYTHK